MKDVEPRNSTVQRKWLLLVVAAIAVGAGVAYFARPLLTKSSNIEPAARAETSAERITGSAVADKGAQRPGGNRPAAWSGGYSLPDKNFEQGRSALMARYGADSPQLASYILEWSHICAKNSVAGGEGGAPEQARARLSEFCAGVSPLSDVEAASLYKKTARIAFSTKLSEVESTQGVDGALNFAEDFIAGAEDPFSMQAGLDYLERVDVLSPPPNLQKAKTRQRMREIYSMARDSYLCDAYGGCTASHPLSAKFCLETNCPALTDYRNQVANHLSRSDLAAFNWYIGAIRSYAK